MNLRQLSYFVQIADLESMTRAASVLHVAQPSLSRQMQMLEHELGVLLFVRSDKGVKLTEAGQALRDRANVVLQQVRHIRDDIGLHASEPKGELKLGLPASLFDLVTLPLLQEFRNRYPQVQIRATEGTSSAMHEMMLTGRLDTAVVSDVEPLNMLRSQLLLREQLYLVGSVESCLSARNEITVRQLVDYPLILTSRPNGLRSIVDRSLADEGLRVNPVVEADSSRLLCELAARGKGYAVLPFSGVAENLRLNRVSTVPIQGMSVTWTMISARDRGISLAARKLRETIMEIVRNHIAAGVWQGVVALD